MVLKGSLREFILADIFNLLSQQKITGKLLLATTGNEGTIIFKDGCIVGASKRNEQLIRKVYSLLLSSRHPHEEMRPLFDSCGNNINGLFGELVRGNLISKERLIDFAASVIEDLCCSFFVWNKGTYEFSSLPYVDNAVPAGVKLPVEGIIMEASRRVDEWQRMRKVIQDESLFVPSEREPGTIDDEYDPVTQPEQFLLSRLDGITNVANLIRSSCLTEYRVYETLTSLLKAGHISPPTADMARSVVAEHDKSGGSLKSKSGSSWTGVVVIIALNIILLLAGSMINRLILQPRDIDARQYALEQSLTRASQKVEIATLTFRALYGTPTVSTDDLIRTGLL
nr:DUF4388 domain-containing protein [Chitinispirillaceae bacterium]